MRGRFTIVDLTRVASFGKRRKPPATTGRVSDGGVVGSHDDIVGVYPEALFEYHGS